LGFLPEATTSFSKDGAGAIGIQLAGIWNKLGTKVVLLEAQESFMNMADHTF
jgi:pyruvate/2-oxoglutarate dehydrogenase complex dihydrolipoamide dehydrogenase (E3) component